MGGSTSSGSASSEVVTGSKLLALKEAWSCDPRREFNTSGVHSRCRVSAGDRRGNYFLSSGPDICREDEATGGALRTDEAPKDSGVFVESKASVPNSEVSPGELKTCNRGVGLALEALCVAEPRPVDAPSPKDGRAVINCTRVIYAEELDSLSFPGTRALVGGCLGKFISSVLGTNY